MKNRIDTLRYMAAESRVTHISAHYFKAGIRVAFKPAPVVE